MINKEVINLSLNPLHLYLMGELAVALKEATTALNSIKNSSSFISKAPKIAADTLNKISQMNGVDEDRLKLLSDNYYSSTNYKRVNTEELKFKEYIQDNLHENNKNKISPYLIDYSADGLHVIVNSNRFGDPEKRHTFDVSWETLQSEYGVSKNSFTAALSFESDAFQALKMSLLLEKSKQVELSAKKMQSDIDRENDSLKVSSISI